MAPKDFQGKRNWAELRQAQLKTLKVPNTSMAVEIDQGEWNDIHPLNKIDVGKRLALQAMKLSFHIAGIDKKFVAAKTEIVGNKIIVSSDSVSHPVFVRYAWADNPQGASLYNKDELPASPFEADIIK